MQLRQKIDKIKNEKFDAKSKVKSSSVLQKTIRDCGVQMVNHDIECEGSFILYYAMSYDDVIINAEL